MIQNARLANNIRFTACHVNPGPGAAVVFKFSPQPADISRGIDITVDGFLNTTLQPAYPKC